MRSDHRAGGAPEPAGPHREPAPPRPAAETPPHVPAPAPEAVPAPEAGADYGGDEVCWLSRVCEACGRLTEGRAARLCEACGEPLPAP